MHTALQDFHPIVREWFEETFVEPSPPQVLGWDAISSGKNTLILAPTGSGKTLAAFLWAINHLVQQHLREDLSPGIRILYVSPLKALNNDIERNLEGPLHGIKQRARTAGLKVPGITTAVRTGDTPQSRRAAMLRHPPDILITTPESLYLMLTSKRARKLFTAVQYVIVDEIHSVCSNKRGVHLSITLERLAAVADQEFIRIGLSATQRPLERVAAFLGGQHWAGKKLVPRPVHIVDAGQRKEMDLRVECAVPDFSTLPQERVWPLVFAELLELIRLHKTTLIFVNNRRLAERVAAKLNEMITGAQDTFNLYAVPLATSADVPVQAVHAGEGDLVQAYHGSMSRHAREKMEADLKAGKLRALVATSSLELGIDIGSIDLVVQLQSPKGVARGLQRVGRSGHLVHATSKGRIFPTHREDLVESAIVARAMAEHEVEETSVPRDCLDVLAQQIVAMVSVEEWDIDALYDLLRQSFCYRSLSRKLYHTVLQMLAGRYRHEAFRELKARISLDAINNTLRALPGSNHLAITSGGTISDRGYFGVFLEDGKTKVGEVDEEFVHESRIGDTFFLGTTVWRMTDMDANRITVSPAPGQPARMPFWRGEGFGRSFELARLVGAFRRAMNGKLDEADCLKWLQTFPIDSRSAWNIQEYLRKQRDSTGTIPNDRLIIIEGFRDEIGDPRIAIHSSFGRRINGLLSLVALRRIQQSLQTTPQMLSNDDGILVRCSDVDTLPLDFLEGITAREANEIVMSDLITSPLFVSHFRQNAARALLMPKLAPGKRTPLWLQRLRAGDLLQIARQFDDFPIVIETMREVLSDVLDFEHFQDVVSHIEDGSIGVRTVQTEIPSPFAASMLFDFVSVYMYEPDQSREDRQSQYLSINRELLSEIVDITSSGSLIRPEAVETVERQLQRTAEGYRARSPEELLEILLRLGDLSESEITERCMGDERRFILELASNGRAIRVRFGKEERWVAGEEQSIYEAMENTGVCSTIVLRYLQGHGPTTAAAVAERYALSMEMTETVLARLASKESIVQGHFSSETQQLQWCYKPNLERIHRQTIGILRREIKPSSLSEFTHFLFAWQHLEADRQLSGSAGVQECLEQLQGLPLPSEIWERDILRSRVRGYSREFMDRTAAGGTMVWAGTAGGKMQCLVRGEGSAFLDSQAQAELSLSTAARRVLEYVKAQGASFLTDIRSGTQLSLDALNRSIAELFWAGIVTNDVHAELQNLRTGQSRSDLPPDRIEILSPRRNPGTARLLNKARRALRQVPGWSGRWSLVHLPGVMGDELNSEERSRHQAVQLLERYGIVARELYRREELLPWALIASELQRMELRGDVRRGYFVEGLSGMQFALPAAVEELRRIRSGGSGTSVPLLVNVCDPANPYGQGVSLPPAGLPGELRLTRTPSHYIVFLRGAPLLLAENYGARLWTFSGTSDVNINDALRIFLGILQLPPHLRPVKSMRVEHCDGVRPVHSRLEPMLRALGFTRDRNQTMVYEEYV